jgi:hypothetical protein
MSRRSRVALAISALLGAALLAPLVTPPAGATLGAVGATNPQTGFPTWYQDNAATALQLCLDAAFCTGPVPDPNQPASVATGNFPDETFYWRATSTMATGGGAGKGLLALALEAAFLNGGVVDGDQITFGRIRVRADHLVPGASYTVTHPFGTTTLTASTLGAINDTVDVGCFASPCNFAAALGTAVGPFLRWDPAVAPAAPAGHLGDPFIDHAVTGSPAGTNFFRIDGLSAGGPGVNTVSTDLFGLEGAIIDQPAALLSPATLAFGDQRVGTTSAPLAARLTNGGTLPMTVSSVAVTGLADFAIPAGGDTCTGASLAPGASCTVSVAFTPGVTGARSASLTFTDSAPGGPHSLALQGRGIAPAIQLTPSAITFGDQSVGSSSALETVTVTNTGTASGTVSTVTKAGTNPGDFTLTDGCSGHVLAANGGSCALGVRFVPQAGGARSAVVNVNDNAPGSPHTLALSGNAVSANVTVSPTSLVFASQAVSTSSAAQTITVTSAGPGNLVVSSVTVVGTNPGDFPTTSTCVGATFGPGTSCTVSVRFAPTAVGSRSATVRIVDNTTSGVELVPVSGTAVASGPAVTLTPNPLDFGSTPVDAQVTRTITVRSSGTTNLVVSRTSLAGSTDFSFGGNNCNGASLAPGASCTITIRFRPRTAGLRTATLTLTTNLSPSSQSVAIRGTGA